jgi:MoaA/NifB/PqqE/SkfB family radical SAM enzyme
VPKQIIEHKNNNGFPPTICIQLLKWCNLKCINCRAGSSPLEKEGLDFQQLKRLLTDLRSYGEWRISLTGGEPFFWPELVDLLQLIADLQYPFSITTNGFASKKPFDEIPAHLWKNGTLYVSIDGDREIHDLQRSAGSYDRALSFIQHARTVVPKLYVNTVMFQNPSPWAKKLYEILNESKVDNWTIISPVMVGRFTFDNGANATYKYKEWYHEITGIGLSLNGKMTMSFLDFASTDSVKEGVVFINSNGEIRLPGFYQNKNEDLRVKSIGLGDSNAADTIAATIGNLIENECQIL